MSFPAILGFIAPPMAVVFLFGVLWKRATRKAANFVLSVGTMISLGTGVCYLWVLPNEDYHFWPHFLLLSFLLFALLSIAIVVISLFDHVRQEQNQLDYGKLNKPSERVIVLWGLLMAVMVTLYVIFNGH